MGSAGKHLASGERSLLDAFQIAAKAVADESLGVLVPFHTFYLAIEGFLDSVVTQVIAQAERTSQLQPFDVDLLKTLFMVKYVKEVSANLDNLTTLSLRHIDQDKNQLKSDVEASLARLEKQTLIQRSGDSYSFLTNEEQDIGREIKNTKAGDDEVSGKLQSMVWDTIFTDKKLKFRQRYQYGFNRKLDDRTYYGQQVNDFGLHIITPYADRYLDLQEDTACLMAVSDNQEVLVRLPENKRLLDEVDELVRTENYIRNKNTSALPPTIQNILSSLQSENSKRQERIISTLRHLIAQADVFAANSKVDDIANRDAKTVLTTGLIYLVENVYTKIGYVDSCFDKDSDITNALTRDSLVLKTDSKHPNSAAHQDMLNWLNSERRAYRQISIRKLVGHFTVRPYGWSELDALGVMAELINIGKAELRCAQAAVNVKEVGLVSKLRSKQGMDSYVVRPCDEVDPGSLGVAKHLGSDGLLADTPPSDAVKLYETYQDELKQRCELLHKWKTHAEQENLPFVPQLSSSLELLQNLLASDGMAAFFLAMKEQRDVIEDYIEDADKLSSFFNNQLPLFKQARNDIKQLEPELTHLSDVALQDKVQKARQILAMDDPTGSIPQLRTLLVPVQEATKTLRQGYVAEVQQAGQSLKEKLSQYVATTHSAVAGELDVALLTQPITQKLNALSTATTIDSTLARKGEIQALEARLYQEIDQAAEQIIEQKTPIPHVEGGGDPPPVVIPQKPIVAVRVASKAPQQVLESEADVDAYLAALRQALMAEINQNKRVRVE